MIKVNLLRDQSTKKHLRKKSVFPTFTSIGFLMTVGIVLIVAGMAIYYFSLTSEVDRLIVNRDRLRLEFVRLQGLKRQITEFERLKQLQESKIQVIEQLKEAQTGPVLLLNHVIQSIPQGSGIWLTNLDQKGERVAIVGYTKRAEYLPDFMTNLAATKFFKSVDLEVIQDDRDASKFSLICVAARRPKA